MRIMLRSGHFSLVRKERFHCMYITTLKIVLPHKDHKVCDRNKKEEDGDRASNVGDIGEYYVLNLLREIILSYGI